MYLWNEQNSEWRKEKHEFLTVREIPFWMLIVLSLSLPHVTPTPSLGQKSNVPGG